MANNSSNAAPDFDLPHKPLLGQSILVETLFGDVIGELQDHFSKNITIGSIVEFAMKHNQASNTIDLTHHIVERIQALLYETNQNVTNIRTRLTAVATDCLEKCSSIEDKFKPSGHHLSLGISMDPEFELLAYHYLCQVL